MSETKNRDMRLSDILSHKLNPQALIITNQSDKHSHHSGDDGTGQTHYDVTIISDAFSGISKVNRHRMVTDLLQSEFDTGLHALSLTLKTPQEDV
ncbi:MAG: BolA protein [Alphaproteobacteria bacterium]|jgi:BolA protein